ncbi:uncharacterized protein LOC111085599 isoform X1 [Limulus polyphemus]|uniref:Uncharacterized protein LOC111085599 isoform X1 n=1 Tax=Limulus polyphemus TaxID=6850 RepID=A0ABM1SAH1_LIMPO|nr:uncharacterized protein LOC111085599 isoform X1 [Limulus polyphemus]
MVFSLSDCEKMFGENSSISRIFSIMYPYDIDCSEQTFSQELLVKDVCSVCDGTNDTCADITESYIEGFHTFSDFGRINYTLGSKNVTSTDIIVSTSTVLDNIHQRRQTQSLLRCDGALNSSAFINRCGHCVQGQTNRSINYGINACEKCSFNDCLRCDGKQRSEWLLDACEHCTPPVEACPSFGVWYNFIDISGSSSCLKMSVYISALYTEIKSISGCWLISKENTPMNPPVNVKVMPNIKSTDIAYFSLNWNFSQETTEGIYDIFCRAELQHNSTVDLRSDSRTGIIVYNSTKWTVTPKSSTVLYIDGNKEVLLEVTEANMKFETKCVTTIPNFKPAVKKLTNTLFSCDLSSLVSCSKFYIRLMFSNTGYDICKTNSVRIQIGSPAHKIQRTYMNEYIRKVELELNIPISNIAYNCKKIFSPSTIEAYDLNEKECTIEENKIHIYLSTRVELPQMLNFTFSEVNYIFHKYCPTFVGDGIRGSFTVLRTPVFPKFEVFGPDSFCCNTVNLRIGNIVGDGGAGLQFTWNVINGTSMVKEIEISRKNDVHITVDWFQPHESYTFIIRGVSQLGLEYVRKKTIVYKKGEKLTATMSGPEKLDSLKDNTFTVHVDMDEQLSLNEHMLGFIWSLRPTDHMLPTEWGPTLTIPGHLVRENITYHLQVIVFDKNDPTIWTKVTKDLQTSEVPVMAIIQVENMIVSLNKSFCLYGSLSRYPSSRQGSLSYEWSCSLSGDIGCYTSGWNVSRLEDVIRDQVYSSSLCIPGGLLPPATYNFSLVVFKGRRRYLRSAFIQITNMENYSSILVSVVRYESDPDKPFYLQISNASYIKSGKYINFSNLTILWKSVIHHIFSGCYHWLGYRVKSLSFKLPFFL